MSGLGFRNMSPSGFSRTGAQSDRPTSLRLDKGYLRVTIRDLPEELLETIFWYANGTTSSAALWNCMKTCRQWHRVGIGIHGRLDYSANAIIESNTRRKDIAEETLDTTVKVLADLEWNPPSQLLFSELRSLTVHVLHARIATPFNVVPGKDLCTSLVNAFRVARKLSTFSLRFSDEGWDFPHLDVPAIPQSQLARLVAALPRRVVNLEIDTAGTDVPPNEHLIIQEEADHLCYQISEILARLRHLRLRVGHVCRTVLASSSTFRNCTCGEKCDGTLGRGRSVCSLVRFWTMRDLTVWLPWGQHEKNNSFASAFQVLKRITHNFGPTIIMVYQNDHRQPNRESIIRPLTCVYNGFSWDTESNMAIYSTRDLHNRQVYRINGYSDHNHRPGMSMEPHPCGEHQLLTRSPQRYFRFGSESSPKSPHQYMAEWYLEGNIRWAQDGHRSCRFPFAEGNEPHKPFWKASYTTPSPASPRHSSMVRGGGTWSCLFPKCNMKCESFPHLRGHLLYAHPERPHHGPYHGAYPCPSPGCSKVGLWGFYKKKDLEEHLLGHHLRPCAMPVSQLGMIKS